MSVKSYISRVKSYRIIPQQGLTIATRAREKSGKLYEWDSEEACFPACLSCIFFRSLAPFVSLSLSLAASLPLVRRATIEPLIREHRRTRATASVINLKASLSRFRETRANDLCVVPNTRLRGFDSAVHHTGMHRSAGEDMHARRPGSACVR